MSLKIGHTAITWRNEDIVEAVKSLAKLRFAGIEAFGSLIETMLSDGTAELCKELDLPIVSAYCSLDLLDPAKRDDALAKIERWAGGLDRAGCKVVVIGGDAIDRRAFDFHQSRAYVIDSINEYAKRFADRGVLCSFHPHTGTPVETESEIRGVIERLNSAYVGFAPDVGQIQKGGSDAMQIVKEYYPLIKHMHLKDYIGGALEYDANGKEIDKSGYLGYTPLGRGVLDIRGILEYLDANGFGGYVMVELDSRKYGETEYSLEDAYEAAAENMRYLERTGFKPA